MLAYLSLSFSPSPSLSFSLFLHHRCSVRLSFRWNIVPQLNATTSAWNSGGSFFASSVSCVFCFRCISDIFFVVSVRLSWATFFSPASYSSFSFSAPTWIEYKSTRTWTLLPRLSNGFLIVLFGFYYIVWSIDGFRHIYSSSKMMMRTFDVYGLLVRWWEDKWLESTFSPCLNLAWKDTQNGNKGQKIP